MESIFRFSTWQGLITLGFLLLAIYGVLHLARFLVKSIGQKNITNKRIVAIINRVLLLFKPMAGIVLLLDFIAINYVTHTILIVVVGTFGYHHIKNYIFGLFLKMNPLVKIGVTMQIEDTIGELKSFLPFGAVFNTEKGERYVSYSTIEQNKFSVNSNREDVLRQTLFLETELTADAVLDVLFNNPIVDFDEKPIVRSTAENNRLKLQYTLENGATTQNLVAFLNEKHIKTISHSKHR